MRAKVFVNGKQVRVLRGKRLRARVVLRGLPKGTYRVRIVAWTNRGRRVVDNRKYRTCVGKRPQDLRKKAKKPARAKQRPRG
ncbi:MAG TPA: hypothetical protein VM266_00790 [Solirubrobacteraceae bacterium]|nr:hypothetical protein [Solirubrobacteraceae bacterium]